MRNRCFGLLICSWIALHGFAQVFDLGQAPEPVQRIIKSEASAGTLSKIQKIPKEGRTIYEITFKQPNGSPKLIYLNPDGSYVKDDGKGVPSAGGSSEPLLVVDEANRAALENRSAIDTHMLPSLVRDTLLNASGRSGLERVEKGTLNGKTVYEGSFKQGRHTVALRVDEAGATLPDLINADVLAHIRR